LGENKNPEKNLSAFSNSDFIVLLSLLKGNQFQVDEENKNTSKTK